MKVKKPLRVKFIDEAHRLELPEYYPPAGTMGTILNEYSNMARVDWDNFGIWYCNNERFELV